jgi:hypothetical protein
MVVWKGTNHAVFNLIRPSRARAQPGSLHSFVSLIFTHFKRHPDEKPSNKIKETKNPERRMRESR